MAVRLGEAVMLQRVLFLVRWFFLLGLILILLKVGYDLLDHPAIVTAAHSDLGVYLALFAFAVAIYAWFGLRQIGARAANEESRIVMRYGVTLGLLCGCAWILEILVADLWGPANLGSLNAPLYFGSTLVATFLPGLAGLLGGWRAGRVTTGIQAGLLADMLGGLILFLAVMLPLYRLLIDAAQHDAQFISEFRASGLPDLQTFVAGDYVAAMVAHLWIGLVTGLLFGALGGMLGTSLARLQGNHSSI